jgi:hypothetical protein
MTEEARPDMPDESYVAQTPPLPEDSVLSQATPASAMPDPTPRHHHRSSRHRGRRGRRRRRQQRILIGAVIVLAIIAVGAILLLPDKSSKSTTKTAAPASNEPGTTIPKDGSVKWVHASLDGKSVTVVPGAGSTRFVTVKGKAIPAVIAATDAAFAKQGCQGGLTWYQKFTAVKPTNPAAVDRQSAYTAYAVEQGKAKGCSWANNPPPAGSTPTST